MLLNYNKWKHKKYLLHLIWLELSLELGQIKTNSWSKLQTRPLWYTCVVVGLLSFPGPSCPIFFEVIKVRMTFLHHSSRFNSATVDCLEFSRKFLGVCQPVWCDLHEPCTCYEPGPGDGAVQGDNTAPGRLCPVFYASCWPSSDLGTALSYHGWSQGFSLGQYLKALSVFKRSLSISYFNLHPSSYFVLLKE